MKVLFFSEALAPPADEGIKVVARNLLAEMAREHTVFAATNRGPGIPELAVRRLPADRLLLGTELHREVRRFAPDLVVYLPTACATLPSFVRMRLLHRYARRAPTAMVALQPRRHGGLAGRLLRKLAAGPVWVQSERTAADLKALGVRALRLPPAVDSERFRPASPEERAALRQRYGIADDQFVLLHVGHINPNRNVRVLTGLQSEGGVQVVLVGSTSTVQERETLAGLQAAGARVITEFVPEIQDLYRMSDAYLFPVESPMGCIDMPLSVLEAMACDLPVVSTRFGGLPQWFPQAPGLAYFEGEAALQEAVRRVWNERPAGNRRLVEPLTWSAAAQALVRGSLGGQGFEW
jgi:glycosyltransferase involved in cell wall biosynthesis